MSRIKIVLGALELEYEGEQSFIEDALLTFTEQLVELGSRVPTTNQAPIHSQPSSGGQKLELSTNTVAQIISAKTGSDLALAAVAKINIIRGQPTASRQEILDEMKQATTYYKETYAGNFSAYLDTLVKSRRINMVAKSTYALAAAERGRLEATISNEG